jgi:hypothetical protein
LTSSLNENDQGKEDNTDRTFTELREKRNVYRVLEGKPEVKNTLGRHRREWQYDIKTDLREKEWGGMDWINMTQDRKQWWALMSTVMKIQVT